ncbi:poly [ADP-ribose] polymerase 14-like [Lingula anatina]|uniref:Poly [ADP-ribose] polymerase 14-like n=1 Tax=Lingula anatina TaxID=7574 RepID=A0A1S3ID14_LINAN|nr:poly [ADP-ribose] polymerase 14-like [Lingula anatina]|eukprot:XP_013395751.1 poly [ADP-ribose] polymerase 14-like [Lingula anatina]
MNIYDAGRKKNKRKQAAKGSAPEEKGRKDNDFTTKKKTAILHLKMPAIFSQPLEKQELQINAIDVEVVVGVDMTKLKADAYCNSTDSDLDLMTGALAKRLRIVGGVEFEKACRAARTTDGVAVTVPGKLNCKHVIHLDIHHRGSWKDKMLKVLNKADSLGITSIVIPAFGTGAGRCDPDVVSEGMFEGVAQYAQGDKLTVKKLTIVVYEKSMAGSFQMGRLA